MRIFQITLSIILNIFSLKPNGNAILLIIITDIIKN